jgi:hypothetical protein
MKQHRDGTVLSLILRALSEAPHGSLLTTELTEPAGYGDCPPQRAQSKVGNILRRAAHDGLIEWCGLSTEVGWQRCPIYRYRITAEGRELVAWWDAAPTRLERLASYRENRAAHRAAMQQAFAEAKQRYGHGLPRWERQKAAIELRGQYRLTLRMIAEILGVSSQQIHNDVTAEPYPPYRLRSGRRAPSALRTLDTSSAMAGMVEATLTEW